MELLDFKDYKKVLPLVENAEINILFALFVLKGGIRGEVFTDNTVNPSAVYLKHPYGMSLAAGSTENDLFNNSLLDHLLNKTKYRSRTEWLQVYPEKWHSKIRNMLGNNLVKINPGKSAKQGKVTEYGRINFKFNPGKYKKIKIKKDNRKIVRTTNEMVRRIKGSVIPSCFWNSPEDFHTNGIGFSLLTENGIPASTAFASFIVDNKLEIGIETAPKHRGKAYAFTVSSALIDYCLNKGFEPVWSCHTENHGSIKLALKLGFEEHLRIPYYRLPL
jgi:GNAT superfamily N-acetyltransferase